MSCQHFQLFTKQQDFLVIFPSSSQDSRVFTITNRIFQQYFHLAKQQSVQATLTHLTPTVIGRFYGVVILYPRPRTDRRYKQFYNNTHHLLDFFRGHFTLVQQLDWCICGVQYLHGDWIPVRHLAYNCTGSTVHTLQPIRDVARETRQLCEWMVHARLARPR